jgi:hypothetical protein
VIGQGADGMPASRFGHGMVVLCRLGAWRSMGPHGGLTMTRILSEFGCSPASLSAAKLSPEKVEC